MEKLPDFIANHLFLSALFIALLSLLLWDLLMANKNSLQVSPANVTNLINHKNAMILDVRGGDEFSAGHIINAVNIEATKFSEPEKTLKKYKDKTIILCCQHGHESKRIAQSLGKQGFAEVSFLQGGISAWRNNQLPLIKIES